MLTGNISLAGGINTVMDLVLLNSQWGYSTLVVYAVMSDSSVHGLIVGLCDRYMCAVNSKGHHWYFKKVWCIKNTYA